MPDRQRDQRESEGGARHGDRESVTSAAKEHPVGARVGAYGGGLAGAIVGTAVGGPAGGILGTAVGVAAGGLAGIAAAQRIDPAVEDAFWRDSYQSRPYVGADETYETYRPAYRHGWEWRLKHAGRSWEQAEPELGRDWNRVRGLSSLEWNRARVAAEDAWHRVDRALAGGADRRRH
jgi:hypothetical protein